MHKTTIKDFENFKMYCDEYIKKYGLISWELFYKHETFLEHSRASFSVDLLSRLGVIYLSTEWNIKPNKIRIQRVAFHEIMEILICKLVILAKHRYITHDEIEEETHVIIRSMENAEFDTYV